VRFRGTARTEMNGKRRIGGGLGLVVVGFGTLDGSGESRPASDVARVRLLFLARARPRSLFVFGTGDNARMWPCGFATVAQGGRACDGEHELAM
jgi:hypothetical protein